MTQLTTIAPEIPRDRYGRPLVIPKGGGKPVPYTRCTTFIDCIEDKFNLQQWMQRMVALGLSQRPDLLLAVAAHRDDKKRLTSICDEAREAAAASAKATTGTAIHALTEVIDRGQDLPVLPEQAARDLAAYQAATSDLKATHIEQFTVLDTLQIGGTPDRIVTYQGNRYIADIKTGSIDYGALKIAAQLAVYARSETYDIATGARDYHGADTTRGLIIHVPAGEGIATLHWVDLLAGWEAVKTARDVREKRRIKFADLVEPFVPGARHTPISTPLADEDPTPTLEDRVKACTRAEDVRVLWQTHQDEWTDELTKIGAARVAEIELQAAS